MIIAVFILLSIPVGYLLGGKLGNVKHYKTRALGLPIAAYLLEAAAPFLRNIITIPIYQWHWILISAEYLLLFAFCFLNRETKAIWVIFVSCLLNFFVITLFGFQMPIAPYAREIPEMAATIARIDSGEFFRYTIATVSDPFWFLGDVILIPLKHVGGFASIGDLLLGLGCGWLFCNWMLTEKKSLEENVPQTQHKAVQE